MPLPSASARQITAGIKEDLFSCAQGEIPFWPKPQKAEPEGGPRSGTQSESPLGFS